MKLLDKVAIVIGMTLGLFSASLLYVGYLIAHNKLDVEDIQVTYKILHQLSSN